MEGEEAQKGSRVDDKDHDSTASGFFFNFF